MIDNKKRIELYFDSRIYNNEEVLKNIKKAKSEFANKQVDVKIQINNWGVYVIKMDIQDKITYIKQLKTKFIKNKTKENINKKSKKENMEKYYQVHTYGKYKETKKYLPYKI